MTLTRFEVSVLIHEIVKTLGMDPKCDDDCHIIVDDDWSIYLSKEDSAKVFIEFDPLMDSNCATDIAFRFCRILNIVGIEVFVGADINFCDSCDF
jgi:hypothetical protein